MFQQENIFETWKTSVLYSSSRFVAHTISAKSILFLTVQLIKASRRHIYTKYVSFRGLVNFFVRIITKIIFWNFAPVVTIDIL